MSFWRHYSGDVLAALGGPIGGTPRGGVTLCGRSVVRAVSGLARRAFSGRVVGLYPSFSLVFQGVLRVCYVSPLLLDDGLLVGRFAGFRNLKIFCIDDLWDISLVYHSPGRGAGDCVWCRVDVSGRFRVGAFPARWFGWFFREGVCDE
jgi:hypothetical protein